MSVDTVGNELFNHCRQYTGVHKQCDKAKEEFSEYERRDVTLRENLKHANAREKTLAKNIEQEKKKVEYPQASITCPSLILTLKYNHVLCMVARRVASHSRENRA